MTLTLLAPMVGLITMIFVALFYSWVDRQDAGTPTMQEIALHIREGARTFLRREFRSIARFIVGGAVLLLLAMWPVWQIAFGFVTGALFSMLAMLIGMNAAVRASVRTSSAARTDPGTALTIAFRGGATMGPVSYTHLRAHET